MQSESLYFLCGNGVTLDKNNYAFIINFNAKEKMSDTQRQKFLTFSHLSPDNLASWAAAPSTVFLLKFMFLLNYLPFKKSCRSF